MYFINLMSLSAYMLVHTWVPSLTTLNSLKSENLLFYFMADC